MRLSGRGQRRVQVAAGLIVAFAVELHRQHFAQRAVGIAAVVERTGAAEHREAAAVADKIPDPLEVDRIKISAVRKVVEHDHVEVFQFF